MQVYIPSALASHEWDVNREIISPILDRHSEVPAWETFLQELYSVLLDPMNTPSVRHPDPTWLSHMESVTYSHNIDRMRHMASQHPRMAMKVTRLIGERIEKEVDWDQFQVPEEEAPAPKPSQPTEDQRPESDDQEDPPDPLDWDEDPAPTSLGSPISAFRVEQEANAWEAINKALGRLPGTGAIEGKHPYLDVPESVIDLLLKDPDLRQLLLLSGAMRTALLGRPSKKSTSREGIRGYTFGGLSDIADLTPTALAALGGAMGDELQTLELYKLLTNRSPAIEHSPGNANAGPIIVLIDNSGSMMGNRFMWARALGLAITMGALRAKRKVHLAFWDDSVKTSLTVTSLPNLIANLPVLHPTSMGGTNLHRALSHATSVIGTLGDPAGVDILVVSDGDTQDVSGQIKQIQTMGSNNHVNLLRIGYRGPDFGYNTTWQVPDDVVAKPLSSDSLNLVSGILNKVGAG